MRPDVFIENQQQMIIDYGVADDKPVERISRLLSSNKHLNRAISSLAIKVLDAAIGAA